MLRRSKKTSPSLVGEFILRYFFRKDCFIFVQTVSSSVFIARCALPAGLFHKVFNTTVENF
jgi:hypothetical protein